jgi:hypothetical protein
MNRRQKQTTELITLPNGLAVEAPSRADWELLRLMDVHTVCGSSTPPAVPAACVH